MLTKKQIKEIREHLEKAQNPIFFFDNDPDGLCSFLLLQRYIGRGKGVAIRSFPGMSLEYFRKIDELNGDYIFILDKPVIGEAFFKKVEERNLPVVWIDHHVYNDIPIPDFINYYNPLAGSKKSSPPTTYLCYQVAQKKEDIWLVVAGSVADHYTPDVFSEFREKYPELARGIKNDHPFNIFYKTEIGKVARIFGFALKDRTTNVVNMIKFLMKARGPDEVLEETNKNHSMHQRFDELNKKYQKLLDRAEAFVNAEDKILFFKYAGDLSISSDLSNELSFKYPDKIVMVTYIAGIKANISIRGKGVRPIVLKAITGLNNSRGGGHEDAVGAEVMVDDLEKFRERVEALI